ncbi:MAG: hypothetical protein KF866_07800 [Phycisphaeraceae bacterium]|nr:hypothetical protein [Phycisphaeraceae bacterium]
MGITDHIDDAALQQFVNSKTNRAVEFSYESLQIDGATVGILRISVQPRPLYALKPYGDVAAKVVYYRQGSANAIAEPDVIALMGKPDVELSTAATSPELSAFLCDSKTRERIEVIPAFSREWYDAFAEEDFEDRSTPEQTGWSLRLPGTHENKNYWRDLANYIRSHALAVPILWEVHNSGTVVARDVAITVTGSTSLGCEALDDLPDEPSEDHLASVMSHIAPSAQRERRVLVDSHGHRWTAIVRMGDVHPGSSCWSQRAFYVGWQTSGRQTITAVVTAANLPRPISLPFEVDVNVHQCGKLTQELVEDVWYKWKCEG